MKKNIRRQRLKYLCLFFILCLFPAGLLSARESGYLQQHYNKHEYRIPMRDGITLFTAVYTPKDTSQDFPIMLERTPYSVAPYGNGRFPENIGPWLHLAEEGFIFVFQDVRGRFMSEGDFVNMRPHNPRKKPNKDIDESSDTFDTIDWLVKNIPRNNGKVGMWGISYPGFYAAMGTIDAHPALKAVSPQAPIANWFVGDDFHHNGAFNLPLAFGFFTAFGVSREHLTTHWPPRFDFGTPDGYRFYLDMGPLPNANKKYLKGKIPFWNDLMKHGTYDKFWQVRNTLQYFHHIKPAVMTVGGWFDAEDCYGALHTYQAIEANNPGIFNILVMGPWYHGGWVRSDGERLGNINFGSKTGEFYVKNMELPFFCYFLKDKGELNLPEAFVFETGSDQWKKFDHWPPADLSEKHFYFAPDGAISFDAPAAADAKAFDEYVSDPAAPVPFTTQISTRMPKEYMVEDQRFASRRRDVLVYQTDVLPRDLTIAGPVTADLYVSTTGTDADWIVKLIDVYPDTATGEIAASCNNKPGGYQMLLRGDIMRGKFRTSYEKPQAFSPGKITRVEFTMNDVCHSFRKGHRIMVQVQSSWFPLFDLNPQKFMDIYRAGESDFRKATQRIYRSKEYPSNLRVNIPE